VKGVNRLITSSIRDNILLGQPFKEKRYQKVLSACDLDVDVSMLPDGDLTQVGDGGMLLSGQTPLCQH
jgi:ABC-type bacteriocin/lantibiotic exporter with double-glycine peptidase domain